MPEYRYNLIRWVPDRERMEPTNVGVILQGRSRIDVLFYPHTAKRDIVDTDRFREWKGLFIKEVQGEPVPLFQPDKNSEQFLGYLEAMCTGPVMLSRPFTVSAPESRTFEQVLRTLYQRLVVPPEAPTPPEESRPTGLFRQLSDVKRFLDRGMRRRSHVAIGDDGEQRLWMAYRQVDNGEAIAMDKVEVAKHLEATANEIERLPLIVSKLDKYLKSKIRGKHTRYFLVVDELTVPFGGQTQRDFDDMRKDLDGHVEGIRNRGGNVLRTPYEVQQLVADLDSRLPAPP